MVAITYVPYRANVGTKKMLLDNRLILVEKLGAKHFNSSVICKEIGEITDARSWDERSGNKQPENTAGNKHKDTCEDCEDCEDCEKNSSSAPGLQDLGHKRNKCRLCDRRMKNKITGEALNALKNLTNDGECVQLVSPP